jgi:iron complex transport system substrate-binding protein
MKGIWLLILLIVALPLTAACGDDDDDGGTDATATTAPADETPTSAPDTAYPVTVTDLLGRDVEIAARPEKIVALSPSGVELVYAMGGTVVGRTSSVTYPEEALDAAEVGTAYQPNFETILGLQPDLIVADSVIHASPNFRQPIEDLGIPVIFVGADDYQDVLDAVAVMGEVLDARDTAATLNQGIEDTLARLKSELAGKDVSAVILIADRDQTLYAAKSNSYSGDLIDRLGIANPAAAQPDAGPFPGYTTLPFEQFLQYNPTIIYTVTPAPPPAPRLSDLIPQIPPLAGLQAVQNGDVVELDVELMLQAPGPRVIEALEAIAAAAAD